MDRNRNLLFGIFAVQLQKVSAPQIVEAGHAWTMNPSVDVAVHLRNAGAISDSDAKLIAQLVEQAIVAHGGNAEAALQTFGGVEQAMKAFHGSIAPGHADWDPFAATVNMGDGPFDPQTLPPYYEAPGRYMHKSEHARGGQGRLLIVHDDQIGRDVIMKELLGVKTEGSATPTPIRQSASIVARFLQEAKITGQLEHPSIVPVYELGLRPDDTPYYTMKLLKGQTLSELFKASPALADRIALVRPFADVCHAIAYAHSRNVIHRDLKPHNIMVGKFGETVVLDWGLAKILGQKDAQAEALHDTITKLKLGREGDAEKTFPGLVVGTPAYMAPEQAVGNLDAVDQRSDVYSLGVILYELLSGKLPFPKDTASAVLARVALEEPPDIAEVAKDAPPELVAICRRCLRRAPSERYQSAAELAQDIDNFLSGALVKAYSYSTTDLLKRFYARNKPVLQVAAASLLVLLGVAVYSYVNIMFARDEAVVARNLANTQRYDAEIRLANESIENGNFGTARAVLDRTSTDQRDWEWGYLSSRLSESRFTFEGCVVGTWSPDGQLIAAIRRNRFATTIELHDASNGSLVKSIADDTKELLGLKFSPDSSRLLAHCMDRRVRVWDVATGKMLFRSEQVPKTLILALFDSSGTRIVTGGSDGVPRVLNAANGELIASLPQQRSSVTWAAFDEAGSKALIVSARPLENPDKLEEVADVSLWDMASNSVVFTARGAVAAMNSTGTRIASGYLNTITLYDTTTSQPLMSYHGFKSLISKVAYAPDGSSFAVGAYDGDVRVFDGTTGTQIADLQTPNYVSHMFYSADGGLLGATDNQSIVVWNVLRQEELTAFTGHTTRGIFSAEFSPDSRYVLTGGIDQTVRVWPVKSQSQRPRLQKPLARIKHSEFSRDGTTLLCQSGHHQVDVYGLPGGNLRTTLGSYNWFGNPAPMAIAPDGSFAVLALDAFVLAIYDFKSMSITSTCRPHLGPILSMTISDDGKQLITGSWDGALALVELPTGNILKVLPSHADAISATALSGTARYAASGDLTGTIALWDLAAGTRLASFNTQSESDLKQVTGLAFSPDESQLAATVAGLGARVFRTHDLHEIRTLDEAGSLTSAMFLPNGKRLLTYWGGLNISNVDTGARLVQIRTNDTADQFTGVSGLIGESRTIYATTQNGELLLLTADDWRIPRDSAKVDSPIPPTPPVPPGNHERVIMTTRESLANALRNLPEALGQLDNRSILDGELYFRTARICLPRGETLLTVNNVDVTSPEFSSAFVDGLIASLPETGHPDIAIGTSSPQHVSITRYILLDTLTASEAVTHDKTDLDVVLKQILEVLRLSDSVGLESQQDRLTDIGETPTGPTKSPGIWVSEVIYPAELRAFLLKTGLTPGCKVLTVQGNPTNTFQDATREINAYIQSLDTAQSPALTITFERGAFETRTLTVNVNG